jgi:predicted DNA-binding transcriptional regulator AlpA
MPNNLLDENRLVRKSEVLKLLGNPHPVTLWKWVREGSFPQPLLINPRSRFVAWKLQEVLLWIEQRSKGLAPAPIAANAARRRMRRVVKRVVLLPAAERGKVRD